MEILQAISGPSESQDAPISVPTLLLHGIVCLPAKTWLWRRVIPAPLGVVQAPRWHLYPCPGYVTSVHMVSSQTPIDPLKIHWGLQLLLACFSTNSDHLAFELNQIRGCPPQMPAGGPRTGVMGKCWTSWQSGARREPSPLLSRAQKAADSTRSLQVHCS